MDEARKTYTDREIDSFHGTILTELKEIKNEVKKTNGRVRLNEKMVWTALGGLGVLSFFVANNMITL